MGPIKKSLIKAGIGAMGLLSAASASSTANAQDVSNEINNIMAGVTAVKAGAEHRSLEIRAAFLNEPIQFRVPDWIQSNPRMLANYNGGLGCVEQAFNREAKAILPDRNDPSFATAGDIAAQRAGATCKMAAAQMGKDKLDQLQRKVLPSPR